MNEKAKFWILLCLLVLSLSLLVYLNYTSSQFFIGH
jgi:hypothetical protein